MTGRPRPDPGARAGWRADAEVTAFVDAALAQAMGKADAPPVGTFTLVRAACVARFGSARAPSVGGVSARVLHVLRARRAAESAARSAAIAEHAGALRERLAAAFRRLREHPAPSPEAVQAFLEARLDEARAAAGGSLPRRRGRGRLGRRRK